MIYDCFTYNGERDLLKIRCEEMKGLDVQHILVESTHTFTGIPKEITFNEFDREFIHFPIRQIIVDDMPNTGNPWDNEKHQRNAIIRGLITVPDDAICIISDVDEIPRASALLAITELGEGITALRMDKFGYYLNCLEGVQSWERARMCEVGYVKSFSPDYVRNSGYEHEILNAGWHFSWMGGPEVMKRKLDSFSHQECNTQKLRDALEHKYQTGESLWGDDHWLFVKVDEAFPEYVFRHQNVLSHLIKPI